MANDITIASWAIGITREMAPAQRQQQVAKFARTALAAVQVVNRVALGYTPDYQTRVNGTSSTALEKVNLAGGEIEFDFDIENLEDVLRWIMMTLRASSPVVSGAYRDGHFVMADGRPFDVDGPIPQASQYTFSNMVPYARRLEIGVTESGRPFVVQVPPRIYERVSDRAAAQFGNRAAISYGAVEVDAGMVAGWPKTASGRRTARRAEQRDWLAQQPAIFVKGR
jgi:hypothetical protein